MCLIFIGDTCNHGDIRLVGGALLNEGRLEICLQRKWGTVCRHSWDSRESGIACEQLGFQSGSKLDYCLFSEQKQQQQQQQRICNLS